MCRSSSEDPIGMKFVIGPSRVRALPLAAGINVGGHYKWHFCQAQPSPSSCFSWLAELALFSFNPATRPPGRPAARPPGRNSSEIAGNQLDKPYNN